MGELHELGYPALTAALYPQGNFDRAYTMIVEAVEGAIETAHAFPPDTLERFVSEHHLTVYSEPPARSRRRSAADRGCLSG